MVSTTLLKKVLVVGSTGATGKHVVRMLLDQGDTNVVALTRSRERLMDTLSLDEKEATNLSVKEASIGSLSAGELKDLTEGCTAVVTCLGHTLNFHGTFREGYFVSDAVKNLTAAMPSDCRYIHMGFDGYPHPKDPIRTRTERVIIKVIKFLLPPVRDNFKSADHLLENVQTRDWAVVRPGDLYDKDEADVYGATAKTDDYEAHDQAFGPLFGELRVSRADTARFMAKLATMSPTEFKVTYNHKMPVIYYLGSRKYPEQEKTI